MSADLVVRTLAQFSSEIWQIGSRINGPHRENSDWDFLVVCPQENLSQVISLCLTLAENIDCLISIDKSTYLKRPWKGPARDFNSWKWQEIGSKAEYEGIKFVTDEEHDIPNHLRGKNQLGEMKTRNCYALRLFPK